MFSSAGSQVKRHAGYHCRISSLLQVGRVHTCQSDTCPSAGLMLRRSHLQSPQEALNVGWPDGQVSTCCWATCRELSELFQRRDDHNSGFKYLFAVDNLIYIDTRIILHS